MKKLHAGITVLLIILSFALRTNVNAAGVGTKKGTDPLSLKVDLGCPGNSDTLKPTWIHWEIAGGCDGEEHDGRGIKNIGDTGIDAYITVGAEGHGNLQPGLGEPICNTYYSWLSAKGKEIDSPPLSNVILRFSGSGLKDVEYWLYTYHNAPGQPPLQAINVTGKGVSQIERVVNVPIQNVQLDDELKPSLVKFSTDGTDAVTVTYVGANDSLAIVNAFHLVTPEALLRASNPSPAAGAKDVPPNMRLTWLAGASAVSHNVYFGKTPEAASEKAEPFKAGLKANSFQPGILELGQIYYWRIDEVNEAQPGSPWQGAVWNFTVDQGKAGNPKPAVGAEHVAVDATLSWKPGLLATSHDVYFGASPNLVSDEAKPVQSGLKNNSFNPGPLEKDTTYYWRVDAIKGNNRVKGDVWHFTTKGSRLLLKVDLALPKSENDPTPLPGTLKPGWIPFVATRWADMYMHDAVWENGSGAIDPPKTDGLGGSGVHVRLDCGGSGNGGFHVYGMARDNLGGGGQPTGIPKGEPIANGWFHNIDWGGENRGDVLMRINGLPAGEYELTCYHNHFEPRMQRTRNRLDKPSTMPNMPRVYAIPLPVNPLPGYRGWAMGTGTGRGVTLLKEAVNIDVTSVTSDDKVGSSVIQFKTDGSNDVLVIIDGGDNRYPDPARPGREGSKGILNAFRLRQLKY